MTTSAQKKASAKYDKHHTRSVLFKFNTTNDADILARLDGSNNKQGYIKELIRNDIRGDGDILSVDAISLILRPFIKRYDLKKVTLFGSYARGSATTESDIDLLIDSNGIESMKDYTSLVEGLKEKLGKNVDVIMADALYSDTSRQARRLKEHIENERIVLYERDQ